MGFQGKTFWFARNCARKPVDPTDVNEMQWNPASGCSEEMDAWPSSASGKKTSGDTAQLAQGDSVSELGTGPKGPEVDGNNDSNVSSSSPLGQDASSPSLLVQVPSPPSLLVQVL